jgi:hypothetical protein
MPRKRGGICGKEGEVVENLLVLQLGQRGPLINGTAPQGFAHAASDGREENQRKDTRAHCSLPIVLRFMSTVLVISVAGRGKLKSKAAHRVLLAKAPGVVEDHSLYLTGNVLEGWPEIASENIMGTGYGREVLSDQPFPSPPVTSETAAAAAHRVLHTC